MQECTAITRARDEDIATETCIVFLRLTRDPGIHHVWRQSIPTTTRAETIYVNLRTRQRYSTLLTSMQTFLPVCVRHLPIVPTPSTTFRTHFQYEHFLFLAFYLIICFLTSFSCIASHCSGIFNVSLSLFTSSFRDKRP